MKKAAMHILTIVVVGILVFALTAASDCGDGKKRSQYEPYCL